MRSEACKRAKAKLVFFDNVYMYRQGGRVHDGRDSIQSVQQKGEIRAQIATALSTKSRRETCMRLLRVPPIFTDPVSRPAFRTSWSSTSWRKGRLRRGS